MADLPNEINPSYTDEDKTLLARVCAWLDDGAGRTQAGLCKQAGVKAGTVSDVVNGKYPSSPTKWLARLVDVVDRYWERQRVGLSHIPYCETRTTQNILRTIDRAHRDCDFGIYCARVGVGKTTAIQRYAETHSAYVIEAWGGIDHSTVVNQLVEATQTKIGHSTTISTKIAAVIRRLRGSDAVILVDEAGRLPDLSLDALRRISDVAGIGCVLIGNADLESRIADPDGRFGQITSRIGFWPAVLERIPAEDLTVMARAFLTQAGEEAGDEAIAQLCESCQGSGRALEKLLRNVLRTARRRGQAITSELVRRVDAETFRGVH